MKQYTKKIDGKTVVRHQAEIILHKDGKMVINPSEEMLLADGWVVYEAPVPHEKSEAQKARIALINARYALKNKIIDYDKSTEVNLFTMKGVSLWLDRDERETLDRRFRIELKNSKTHSTLWKNGMAFELNIEQALAMLDELEMYAIETYDTTQRHLAAVNELKTIEDIEQYDYKVGYPDKLSF